MSTLAPYVTEAEWQVTVIDMAEHLGWTVWHDNDSRRNDPGLPDLLCAHPVHGVVFLELKTERGQLRKEQRYWLDLLTEAGVRAFVARPSQGDDVERLFRGEIERLEQTQ